MEGTFLRPYSDVFKSVYKTENPQKLYSMPDASGGQTKDSILRKR